MVRIKKTTKVSVLKSWVWQHFTKDKENEFKSQCNMCPYSYVNSQKDGSTSTLKHHLLKKHKINKPEIGPSEEGGSSAKKSSFQPVVSWHKKSLSEWLCILVIEDGITFNAIKKSRFFKAAFYHMGLDSYSSHNSIRNAAFKFLDTCKGQVKAEIKANIAAGIKYGVVADEWSSISSRRYMNVCITTADSTVGLGMVRCRGSITAERTVELIEKRLQLFGLNIEDLVGFCSDGASVMKKAGRLMKIPHQLCLGKNVLYI